MPAQIIISLDDAGQVEVSAPAQNIILCYGMLARARDLIKEAHEQAASQAIVPPSPSDVLALRRNGNR